MLAGEGTSAFVTGGGGGIGFGIVKALALRGACVACADIRPEFLADVTTIAQVEGWSSRLVTFELDIADRDAFARVLDAAEDKCGPLEIMVNNAGVGIAGPIVDAQFADWDWGVDVNIGGIVNGVVASLPRLRAHGRPAYLVNTASLGALMPARPTRGIYATTKHAVVGMTEHLRLELEDTPVGVSMLLPGPVRTNIARSEELRPAGMEGAGAFRPERGPNAPLAEFPGMLTPEQVGERVLRGIERNELYIITHPQYLDAIRKRHQAIEDACKVEEPLA
jgi:NAD(P)-dependent dehydrogenase (short-subunit alcohol dehydrogenase family)